jgi:hypothetical protein
MSLLEIRCKQLSLLGVQHLSRICNQVLILQFDTNRQRNKFLIFEDYGLPECSTMYVVDGNNSFERNVFSYLTKLTASDT